MKKWAVLGVAAAMMYAGSQHAVMSGTADARVAGASESAFFGAVLADLGTPDTQADLSSLEAWYPHEYPSWPPGAANNPLDSTLAAPGSWDFNTFDGDLHVQGYPTASEGAQATAETLEGGYPRIVTALRSGNGLCGDPSLAGEFLTWSGDGYSGVC